MKVSKVVIIVLSIIMVILLPILIYTYIYSQLVYNILISIQTGLIASIIIEICHYFVARSEIKNNIFNCYFDMYKTIYIAEHKKLFFHYFVLNIHKKSQVLANDLSKYVAEFSGFIPNKKNKLYKKLNPTMNIDFEKINIKNFTKLILPFNRKKFNELIIPMKRELEEILKKIDRKKFEKEFKEYEKLFNLLNR